MAERDPPLRLGALDSVVMRGHSRVRHEPDVAVPLAAALDLLIDETLRVAGTDADARVVMRDMATEYSVQRQRVAESAHRQDIADFEHLVSEAARQMTA